MKIKNNESGKFENVLLRDLPKPERQNMALAKLESLYDQYPIKPLKYGFTQPSLKDAVQFDYPGLLMNWSEFKRKTTIPNYKELQHDSEGIEGN